MRRNIKFLLVKAVIAALSTFTAILSDFKKIQSLNDDFLWTFSDVWDPVIFIPDTFLIEF